MRAVRPIAHDARDAHGGAIVAGRWTAGHAVVEPRHPVTHSYAALTFSTAGASDVEHNGRWRMRAGDVLLLPAGAPHRVMHRRGLSVWGVAVRVPSLAAQGMEPVLQPFERVRDGASAVVSIPAHRHGYLDALFGELAGLGRRAPSRTEIDDAVARSLLTLILAEVDRATGAHDAAPPGSAGIVVQALRYIERHCLRRLTVDEVAAAVGRTPTHLTTALSHATGRSASQWIAAGRMAEARRLLAHSEARIEEVATRIGYADATHFIRTFRREHGATPAAWRAARALDEVTPRATSPDPSSGRR